MKHVYAILAKTRVGAYFRTTVPEEVRKVLKIDKGDEIVWLFDNGKIIVDRARKEVER